MSLDNLASVEVMEGCEPGAIPEHVFDSDVPVLLKGLISDWPAVQHCNESIQEAYQYVGKFWSGEPVTAYYSETNIDGRFFYNEEFTGFNFKSGTAQLNHVFQKLDDVAKQGLDDSIYVGSTAVDRWLPGFRKENDIRVPDDDVLVNFWMGNATRVAAHFDFPDNVACVVAGRRRFTLFPPEQVENLYVGPLDRTPSGQAISLVDFKAPDFERFPKFKEALKASVTYDLEPGDAIFVPSMWWHNVESLSDFNLLVNYWWWASPVSRGSPTSALLHAILSIRDLPPRHREAWKVLFDHYVFDADESVYEHIPESGRGCLGPLDENEAKKLRAQLVNLLNR